MSDPESNIYFEHYQKSASSYESINSFKKDIAQKVLQLGPTIDASSILLDNACGPGIVTGEVQKLCSDESRPIIHAVDYAPAMISTLKEKADYEHWAGIEAAVMDAEDLKFPDNMFTHSFTNFGIFLFPHPEKAAKEVYRTLKPGGVAFVTSWMKLEWLRILQEVQHSVRPELPPWEGPFGDWMNEGKLMDVMIEGGFKQENVKMSAVTTYLEGEEKEYLQVMKPAWAGRITQKWGKEQKREFDKRISETFDDVGKNECRAIELVTSVAVATK